MSGPELRRRDFLLGAGRALAGLAALPLAGACAPSDALLDALTRFYPDPAHSRAVGAEFLKSFPREDDLSRLVRQLAGSRSRQREWELLATSDPAALHAALRERHHADFDAGRIVELRGWVLSQTEARLCALAALG